MWSIVIKVSLLAFLVSSMLGAGLGLSPRALVQPLRDRRFVLLALATNFVIAPAFAWGLAQAFALRPPHAAGLIILGCAAGAPFLPKLAEAARGDVAQAVALMTLLTAVTAVFLPLVLPRLAGGLSASPWAIARPLLLWILLPLAAGVLAQGLQPSLAARIRSPLAALSNASLVVVLGAVIARDARAMLGVVGSGAIAAIVLFVAGLFAAGLWLGGARPRDRGSLALGAASRNVGAAFVPAAIPSADPGITTMLVVATLVMLLVLLPAAGWLRRRAPA
jgi:bile acid:Na+ symporter, BASS family